MAKNKSQGTDVNIPAEDVDDEILLPGEGPDEIEGAEEMSTVTEEMSAEEIGEAEEIVDDAVKELTERTDSKTIELLNYEDLPADARIIKMQMSILPELAAEYNEALEILREGTSGKDEKMAHAIANMSDENDPSGFALKSQLAETNARIAELTALRDAQETSLGEYVESELSKRGEGIMSETQIQAQTELIKSKYAEFVQMYKATKEVLDNYRQHKNAAAGEIHQYVAHVDRPSGRATKVDGNSPVRSANPSGRAVHVSKAEFSTDNGQTWHMVTKEQMSPNNTMMTLSNPTLLAAELSKKFNTSSKLDKNDIVTTWYAENNQTAESATRDNLPHVSTFDFNFKVSDGKFETVKVRLTKRGQA